MTTFKRGQIVHVRFQFTNKAAAKNRPAIVVSSDAYHASRDDVIITGVTTNLTREDFVGQMTILDWQTAGLASPSAVSGIIQTVRRGVLGNQVGFLSDTDLRSLDLSLKESFGLQ